MADTNEPLRDGSGLVDKAKKGNVSRYDMSNILGVIHASFLLTFLHYLKYIIMSVKSSVGGER